MASSIARAHDAAIAVQASPIGLQVVTGAKVLTHPAQDDNLHIGVRVSLFYQPGQRLHDSWVDRIQRLGAIDTDLRDLVGNLDCSSSVILLLYTHPRSRFSRVRPNSSTISRIAAIISSEVSLR